MKKSAKKYLPLIAARKRAGFTQAIAAKHIGVSLRTYCHWEAGTASPGKDVLEGYVLLLESFSPVVKPKAVMGRAPCAPLIAARKKAKLTQLQAAKILRVSLRTYQNWETGTTSPNGIVVFIATLGGVQPPTPCVLCGHVGRAV